MCVKVAVVSTLCASVHLASSAGPLAADVSPVLDEASQTPGMVEGTGTHFEITDSEFLNIILDSSEEIRLTLESTPEMVSMFIEPTSAAASTAITLSGFLPLTTYYKYEDDYHNLARIMHTRAKKEAVSLVLVVGNTQLRGCRVLANHWKGKLPWTKIARSH